MEFNLSIDEFGIRSINPLPSVDELNEYYSTKYYQTASDNNNSYENDYSPLETEHRKSFFNLLISFIKSKKSSLSSSRILDIGCGEGFLMDRFKDELSGKGEVFGIDFSEYGVKQHNNHLMDHCFFGDLYTQLDSLNENSQKFDILTLTHVLEHVVNPVILLEKIRKIMHKDSYLLIGIPNDFSIVQEELLNLGLTNEKSWVGPPDHLHYFNVKNISPFLERNGLFVEDKMCSFPVDFFLFHEGSNYVLDKSKGKKAHYARMNINLMLSKKNGIDEVLNLYRQFANCQIGRDLYVLCSLL